MLLVSLEHPQGQNRATKSIIDALKMRVSGHDTPLCKKGAYSLPDLPHHGMAL